jgi:2-oxoglutarate dehydrogenase E2 component (dihydrolipoamide succinyltransferase)
MKIEIKVPVMGESVTEAVIGNIMKPSGSAIKRDDELLELETDKVNQVLYAPESGQLTLSVKTGDHVKIGQVIGSVDTAVAGAPAPEAPKAKPAAATPPPPPPQQTGPSARQMAPEFIANLSAPKKAEEKQSAAPTTSTTRKRMTTLRKVIAERLVEAKNTTAMLTTFNEIDMTRVIEIRASEKESFEKKYGARLGFMSFFTKAVVAALKAVPQVGSMIDGGEIVTFHSYDIGIAVATDKGLFVPVIRGCEKLSFGEIELALAGLAKKAKEGAITVDDMRGGCFTISNAGVYGSLLSTPILNPPQSGVLGMHNIVKRPVAIDGEVVIRPMMYVALSYDHRVIDGKEAVTFLVHLKESLEEPSRLLLEL